MEKLIKILFSSILLLFLSQSSSAHEPEKHKKEDLPETRVDSSAPNADTLQVAEPERSMHPPVVDAGWSDFPSVHPLIVHFPIVLLLLAFLAQLATLFIWKKELSLIAIILLLAGFAGAYFAGNFFHPHTDELDELARQVLEKHERYADYTLWLSGVGLLLKLAGHFLFKRKWWLEIAVALVLAAAAWSVSMTGHYGATLVHLHGVGPQGNHLKMHTH